MKVVVAPDSFKGSLTADAVALAMEDGIRRVLPDCLVVRVPVADGGEGTLAALLASAGGRLVEREVTGPLGERVKAVFGVLADGITGVVEMAQASGLTLVPAHRRNPLRTTTFGTGELIRAALDEGCRRLIVGLGGSATVDGGTGMAKALGVRILTADGEEVEPGGGRLRDIATIDVSGLDPRVRSTEVVIAADVDNPLTGPRGAARVFGPQKGATGPMVDILEEGLAHLGQVIERDLGVPVAERPGAGAAGGLGAGLMAFLTGRMERGIDVVLEAVRFREKLAGASLVITGEGQMDGQTVHGKAPWGVAQAAREHGIPVLGIAGSLGENALSLHQHGFCALAPIAPGPISREESMAGAAGLIADAAERTFRILVLGQRLRARPGARVVGRTSPSH